MYIKDKHGGQTVTVAEYSDKELNSFNNELLAL